MNWTKEQNDAINLEGSNIIVSAGAGSGKTAVLSERVLTKLRNGVDIDEMLILTFTKASALEMKDRIRKKVLKDENLKEQLDKIDASYITTFDSYALSVVKKYNYLLGISKKVSIADSSIITLKKNTFLDEILEELYKNKNQDFLTLIDDFYVKDDKSFKKQLLNINNKLDMMFYKEQYLKQYIDNYYNEEYILDKEEEYEKMLFDIVDEINVDFENLKNYISDKYYEKISPIIEKLLSSNDYDALKNNIMDLPMLKTADEEAKKIKESMSLKIKKLKELCCYNNKEEIISDINKTKKYVQVIINIILSLDSKINDYKYKNDIYEFTDIAKMAIRIVKENNDVKEKIKKSFKEIMIDEYQDTNDLQDLFISCIENNNVYMVGDIKQSIYRFRNANPVLFKEKYDTYSKGKKGIKIDLNKNFRSRSEILNNINNIFENIMTDSIGGANYAKSHKMEYGNLEYEKKCHKEQSNDLEVYEYEYDKNNFYTKEEIECFFIARDIKNKIKSKYQVFDKDNGIYRDIRYKDIVILISKSSYFDLYKKIFEYLNIPLSIYKDEKINDDSDIYLFKNIIYLLINKNYDNNNFKHAFISILRSYLFSLDDKEIFKYFLNNNFEDCILMKKISEIDITCLTPYEVIEQIIEKFNFYEKIINDGNINRHIKIFDYMFDISKNLSELGYTLDTFYEYLDKITTESEEYDLKISAKEENIGVKIMTIHGSKGLEYNLCYYSGLYYRFNISDMNDLFMFDNNYGIISPLFNEGVKETIYKPLSKNKYLKEEISEQIRLFYVALTRAREKMIIVMPREKKDMSLFNNNYRSFSDILNKIRDIIRPNLKELKLDDLKLTKNYNFIKISNYKKIIDIVDQKINVDKLYIPTQEIDSEILSKNEHKINSVEEYKKMKYGTKIHSIFENFDFNNPNFAELSLEEKIKIESFMNTGILANAINIYKEYEFEYITNDIKKHGKIDLLIECKDKFKIIDYKSKGINDTIYIEQLNNYKEYIKTITNKKIELYLYSINNKKLEKLS